MEKNPQEKRWNIGDRWQADVEAMAALPQPDIHYFVHVQKKLGRWKVSSHIIENGALSIYPVQAKEKFESLAIREPQEGWYDSVGDYLGTERPYEDE